MHDDAIKRRDELIRRVRAVMGWPDTTKPIYTVIRAVAKGEAVAVGLDKLEEIVRRLEAAK